MGKGYAGRNSEGENPTISTPGHWESGSTDGTSLGHRTVIPPRVGESPGRLDAKIMKRYRAAAVTDVSDAVGRLYTMDGGIRPFYEPMRRVVGVALTAKAPPGDNWAIHGALSMAGEDDVLIIDWQGYREGCGAGSKVLVPAIRRGLAGVIVDGAWRDIGDLRAMDFPMCGRGISAFSPSKSELGEINVAVCCGGVIVEPGDVVIADGEGAVVVPRRHAAEVARYLPDPEQEGSVDGNSHDAVEADPGAISRSYWDAFEAKGGLQGAE